MSAANPTKWAVGTLLRHRSSKLEGVVTRDYPNILSQPACYVRITKADDNRFGPKVGAEWPDYDSGWELVTPAMVNGVEDVNK